MEQLDKAIKETKHKLAKSDEDFRRYTAEETDSITYMSCIVSYINKIYPETKEFKNSTYITTNTMARTLKEAALKNPYTRKKFHISQYNDDDIIENDCEEYILNLGVYCVVSVNVYDDGGFYDKVFIFYNDYKDIEDLYKQSSIDDLKPQAYQCLMSHSGPYFSKVSLSEVTRPELEDGFQDTLAEDMNTFFKNEEFYKTNGFHYKRGALLHGPPGTGKTSALKHISSQINVPTIFMDQNTKFTNELKRILQAVCPNGCVIVIEDIDGIESYRRSELLNFLDGISSPNKCYFVATTNHLEKVDFAISNRPSRFDMVMEVGYPSHATRKKIIELYFKEDATTENLSKLADLTKGFSGAYIKEVYILYKLNEITIEKAISMIRQRLDLSRRNLEDDGEDYLG